MFVSRIGIDQASSRLGLNQGQEAMKSQPRNGVGSRSDDRSAYLAGRRMSAWIGGSCLAGEPDQSQAVEDRERQAVEEIAAKAGLGAVRTTRSAHFLGIGNTSDRFRSLTLQDCEWIAADYLDYYQSRGFQVAMPAMRLTVIILADDRSLAAFYSEGRFQRSPTGVNPGQPAVPSYNPSTNRLVVFDLRSVSPSAPGSTTRGASPTRRPIN